MMNTKRIFSSTALAILLLLSACDQDKTIFQKDAATRVKEQMDDLRQTLLSSPEGWKFVFYPDVTTFGGYHFLVKFKKDGKVEMTSDFDNTAVTTTSNYQILFGSTVKLSFSTKGELHKMADPTNGISGRGYTGDFEFLYYGKDGEDLLFKSNRDYVDIRFQRASVEYVNGIGKVSLAGDPLISLFRTRVLEIKGEHGVLTYGLVINHNFRKITIMTKQNVETDYMVTLTSTGFFTNIPIKVPELPNIEFTHFEYKEPYVFVSKRDDIEAMIYYSGFVIPSSNAYKYFGATVNDKGENILKYNTFLFESNALEAPPTTDAFVSLFTQVNDAVKAVGPMKLLRVDIKTDIHIKDSQKTDIGVPKEGNYSYIRYRIQIGTKIAFIRHFMAYKVENERIRLTENKIVDDGASAWSNQIEDVDKQAIIDALKPLDDFFFSGLLYMDREKRFFYRNDAYSFVNLEMSHLRIFVYAAK